MTNEYKEDLDKTSIIEVVWKDHTVFSEPSWRNVLEELKPALIRSVGYVLRDTDEYFELAETVDSESPISGNHRVILKNTVEKVRVLNGA